MDGSKQHGLPEIVRAIKSFSARRIHETRAAKGTPFWQRNYYEHIIRNERSLNAIREYIDNNPLGWKQDKLHPNAPPNPFNTNSK
jgi:REP element-mobilizing transposase RayT